METGNEVHIVVIEHKEGFAVFANATLQESYNALHKWVVDNWKSSDPIPENKERAVERYFERAGGWESYWLDTITVGG